MHSFSRFVITGLAAASAFAQSPGSSGNSGGSNGGPGTPIGASAITLKIPNETTPAGGVAQMKFLKTEPTPISSGRPHSLYDSAMFDDVLGIQLFDATGDLNGVAMVQNSAIFVNFVCNGAMQGTDYPVMTIALHVRANAPVGAQTQFDLDPSSSFTVGLFPAVIKPIAPATITVAGSVSITNVVPGGGMLPAGAIVKLEGIGFEPRTQVQLSNVQAQTIKVISPTEIDIELAQATDMSGKKIQVVNPDGSQDTYFSYMRGIMLGTSTFPLLAHAVPIFSAVTHSRATFAPIAPVLASQFTGLAMQNQNLTAANVTVSLFSAAGRLLANSTITIPPGYRLMRGISELAGLAPAPGSYVVAASDKPLQIFGFLADSVTRNVTAFPAFVAQP